ncbi:MAG: M15 family metallopeptidase [Bacteroidetes bacterium]|jgi:zinc D-Ala-D-Ala dipeptidase|nr:MAG: peptidase M15 [Cryomorphaceae bacterium BACL29 MAG-121220-bin8]MDA0758485.1 M15 family metallopeptidase [Bacteroidota bacterium]MDA1019482.1 M15 family metallopeptidase [Bacteroidota bacterium]|tara:strand:- start:19253 stop:19933 length:681 start_codon:yes stop_codon:yes gene_type:complete
MKKLILLLLFIPLVFSCNTSNVPAGFSKIESIEPPILIDLRYSGSDNFLGRTVKGYENPRNILLTNETIDALTKVQKTLSKTNLGLKLFDGYRPQKSVNNFVEWAKDLKDTVTKSKYYPKEKKDSLFFKGYISEKSGHSRGSTVDITLIFTDSINYGNELDMGSGWDFFGNKSWIDYDSITDSQKNNRNYLQNIMNQNGFKSFSKEWWHFTLIDEPYPNTYFDFTF